MSFRHSLKRVIGIHLIPPLFSSLVAVLVVGCGGNGGGETAKIGLPPKKKRSEIVPPLEIQTGLAVAGSGITISPDGKQALVWCPGEKQNAELWNLETKARTKTYELESLVAGAHAVTMSPDGKTIAYADKHAGATLVDATSGVITERLRFKDIPLVGFPPFVRFSPKGDLLLTVNDRIVVWDKSGKEKFLLRVGAAFVTEFFDDGKKFATSDSNRNIFIWQIGQPKPLKTLLHKGDGETITFVGLSQDGKTLVSHATGSGGKIVNVWNLADGTKSDVDIKATPYSNSLLTSDAINLLYGTLKGTLVISDLEGGGVVHEWGNFPAGSLTNARLSLTPDGSKLLMLSEKTIRVWDLSSLK